MYYFLTAIAYVTALLLPSPVFFALCFVIAIRFRGYLCLIAAALIDIQFTLSLGMMPFYTLTVIGILLAAEFLRPRLRIDVSI